MMLRTRTQKIAVAIVLSAIVVVMSPFSFPVGPTKCLPWQHMVNAVAGVLLGPWYAAVMATAAGVIRYMLGLGTVFAFPGGIPGALVVGFTHRYLLKSDYAALTEPIGTGLIGAALSALIVGPLALGYGLIGGTMTFDTFAVYFSLSSIPGSVLGFAALLALRRSRVFSPVDREEGL